MTKNEDLIFDPPDFEPGDIVRVTWPDGVSDPWRFTGGSFELVEDESEAGQ